MRTGPIGSRFLPAPSASGLIPVWGIVGSTKWPAQGAARKARTESGFILCCAKIKKTAELYICQPSVNTVISVRVFLLLRTQRNRRESEFGLQTSSSVRARDRRKKSSHGVHGVHGDKRILTKPRVTPGKSWAMLCWPFGARSAGRARTALNTYFQSCVGCPI